MDKRGMRFFNTTGPCRPDMHYMLPPEERLVGAEGLEIPLHRYIGDQLYWVLHAPRQTGKTTFLQSWMREINAGDAALACYVSVERCQDVPETELAMPAICEAIQDAARDLGRPIPSAGTSAPQSMLNRILRDWAELVTPKPLIVLFDEVDVLSGNTLTSFLRQLRDGFSNRGIGKFPVSIALVGMRDLKDYLVSVKDGKPLNPGSPFNIKADSAVLSNFQKQDIAKLFAQRTEETGQQISDEALDYIYEQSRGQPWIVNSLFMRATMRILDENSRETVTIEHIQEARAQMIQARETHLDALAYLMKNPAVQKVMETLLSGATDFDLFESEGFRLCLDLGLVAMENGAPTVANPIYREVLARQMTDPVQYLIPTPSFHWENADGSLDMEALLKAFQCFWRENSAVWEEHSNYTEAFPHLLLMAFLQRVLNGGGRIDREYAAGRGRMDLFIEYKNNVYIIEIKLIHPKKSAKEIKAQGIEQITNYRDTKAPRDAKASPIPAYLIIFDRRPTAKRQSWEKRISWKKEGDITVLGC
jgi:hypothetical protein